MSRSTEWLPKGIYYLASGLYFGAVFLRSPLIFKDSFILEQILGLLLLWLALFISEPAISRRWSWYFPLYLLCQTALVFILLARPGYTDFFAALLPILSMQAMLHLKPQLGALWIGLCAPAIAMSLRSTYGIGQALALTLIFTAGNVFVGTYTLAMRRNQTARLKNQALAQELAQANQQLEALSAQLEQLAVARERNRLARELHDSVTQTVFSMTLTIQSAQLLLDRDPIRLKAQLDRLDQLAHSALAEMQVLISELRPEKAAGDGLVVALRRHLASSRIPETLSVSLEVQGDQPLIFAEEQSLFHIVEEAINNVVKHSQAVQAQIRLHLADPFWVEIEDQGKGFDVKQAQESGRVGLSSMRERALEIGWNLQIYSSPGAGTRIRIEKAPVMEGQV